MAKRQGGIVLGALLLLLSGTAALQAQSDVSDRVREPAPLAGETYIGLHVGYSFIGKYEDSALFCDCDADQNDFLFYGGRVGHFFTDHFALEFTGQYFNPDRAKIHDYWELTLGGLYDFTPRIPGWNTYLGFGGGAARPRVFKGKGNGLAYLAFGSEYRFSKLVGMRLEVKGQYNFSSTFTAVTPFGSFPGTNNPSHVDIQPNIGVLIHFGGGTAPPVVETAPAPVVPPPPPPPAPPATPAEPERPAAPPVAPPPPPPPAPMREPVDFDLGKARISNIVKARLDSVALRLRDNPRATVTVIGYPDTGAGARQETLARQRAENVKQYLVERHGIDASRITTEVDMTDTSYRGRAVIVTINP